MKVYNILIYVGNREVGPVTVTAKSYSAAISSIRNLEPDYTGFKITEK